MILATTIVVIILAFYVVFFAGLWKMFLKADVPGWQAIIPVLNDYQLCRIAWKNKMAFWVIVGGSIILGLLSNITGSGDSTNLIASLIVSALGIVIIVFQVKLAIRVAKAYSHGGGVAALYFFFPFIATIFLGFTESPYQGPQD